MINVRGTVESGVGHFAKRIQNPKFCEAFRRATGENIVKGTLNVKIASPIQIREHFRILGREIDEPDQDLLFELCRINGLLAYRIRPYQLRTGCGGHGDDTLEIACSQEIPNVNPGSEVEISLFRDDIRS